MRADTPLSPPLFIFLNLRVIILPTVNRNDFKMRQKGGETMSEDVRQILCRNLDFFPILPLKITVLIAKLQRKFPKFGFTDRDGKTYFVIGGFRYFMGLRFYL